MLQLLQDIATDTDRAIGLDNPLRQVIINTHSPAVVGQIPDSSLLLAEPKDTMRDGNHFRRVCFSYLPDTWRELKAPELETVHLVPRGKLLSYLNPIPPQENEESLNEVGDKVKRIVDRQDMQQLLLPLSPK
jgi:hypothetical protein